MNMKCSIYKRDMITFFSHTTNKMEGNIRKTTGSNIDLKFKDVGMILHYLETFTTQSFSTIRSA